MRPSYSREFKESVVRKISTPGGPSIMDMSENLGVSHASIRTWLKRYANMSSMKKSKDLTPEDQLQVIIKTAAMTEHELGEYLRANGLHAAEVEEWKQAFYSSQKSPGRPRLDPELVELRSKEKELSKDLRRKDRALAEMSARVILLKKSRAIFGVNEDDE